MKQKQEKPNDLNQNEETKLNVPASCMFMMSVTSTLSKKLEENMGDPSNMFEIICDKYYKKGNNKLYNICK